VTAGPTVIYVAGSGRSGSTLLERTLGEISGFVNVGELIDLFRRVVPRGERCGCGQPFETCPFWAKVGQGTLDGWAAGAVDAVRRLQVEVARQRHIPRLMFPRCAGSRFNKAVREYGAYYRDLYAAIAEKSDAQYVVDASKWPVQALALSRADLDVRVIHLVRDPRGVAHSLGKENIARPHTVGQPEVMFHESSIGAAARWLAIQTEADALSRCGLPVVRMRYEDFVRDPREQIHSALRSLGLCPEDSWLTHVGDGHVSLGSSHGLSGNPSRFRAGDIALRTDLTWQTDMRRRDRLLVTAVAFPQMLKHQLAGQPAESRSS
jgi:Sulfotransferase family